MLVPPLWSLLWCVRGRVSTLFGLRQKLVAIATPLWLLAVAGLDLCVTLRNLSEILQLSQQPAALAFITTVKGFVTLQQ
jgi:hypothetical protein